MASKKTVAVWRSTWLPGSETFIRNQVDALNDWQSQCIGLNREQSALSRDSDVALYGRGIWDRCALRVARWTNYSPRLTTYLRHEHFDLVHAHFAFDGIMAEKSARRAGIPFIVTTHGVDVTMLPNRVGIRGWVYRRRLRRMLTRSIAVVSVSDHIANVNVKWGAHPSTVHVITTGVPFAESATERSGQRIDSSHESDVLFVGRFVDKKGIPDLLSAVAMISSQGLRPRVRIIGDGPDRKEIQESIDLLDGDVCALGALSPSETRRYLISTKLVVVPSRTAKNGDSEGLPTVILEAGSHGIPVVSTYHSGIPEAIEHGVSGLLVPERSPGQLASAIVSLLTSPALRDEMGHQGRLRVQENFSVTKQTARLEALYDLSLSPRSENLRTRSTRDTGSAKESRLA